MSACGPAPTRLYTFRDLLNGGEAKQGLSLTLAPLSAQVL